MGHRIPRAGLCFAGRECFADSYSPRSGESGRRHEARLVVRFEARWVECTGVAKWDRFGERHAGRGR